MLFYAGFSSSPSSISSISPTHKKTSDLRESHDLTRPGQCPPVARLLAVSLSNVATREDGRGLGLH